ncbi:MAG: hypothetical protein HY322_06750 [Betaproteobacteria bacterium]|nr:hypothetical protein [Betaproteobacteria bacterium]
MAAPDSKHVSARFPLWALPAAAGMVPAVAAIAAWGLSVHLGIIPYCNPLIDGCVSISRAARHDLPNHVFRALLLPAAVLQALTWMLCRPWLRHLGARGPLMGALPWLGAAAAAFLVLYGTFLGTEGDAYRWMRRYGIVFYFGLTFLCMVSATGALSYLARAGVRIRPGWIDRILITVCVITLAAGLVSVLVPHVLEDGTAKNRIENVIEWNVALAFTLFFLLLAWLWRGTQFAAYPATTAPPRADSGDAPPA